MKTLAYMILMALAGPLACPGPSAEDRPADAVAPQEKPAEPSRIGVYDSRAVAIAYCNTELHKAEIRRLDKALEEAKRAGDEKTIHEADRAVWEARKRSHRQAFSTHPVDDILTQIPEEVKRIQQEAGVGALVSKWDDKGLAKHKKAEQMDVTQRLIDALKPNERQRRWAMEILKVKPIPPEQYEELLKKEAGEHY